MERDVPGACDLSLRRRRVFLEAGLFEICALSRGASALESLWAA